MRTKMLNDISKPTNQTSQAFIALAGKIEKGNKMLAGLKIGTSVMSGKGSTTYTPYIEIFKDMTIDHNYIDFYHANKEENQKFSNFSEALKNYNETILGKVQSPEVAQNYLMRNIVEQDSKIELAHIKSDFSYRPQMRSCYVLTQVSNKENAETKTVVLLDESGKFAVVENVGKDRFGKLDFSNMALPSSKFDIEDLQEALNQLAIKTKSPVKYGTEEVKSKIESEKITDSKSTEKTGQEDEER